RAAGVAEESVDVHETAARADAFVADVAVVGGQVAEQRDLVVGSRREFRVAAFACKGLEARAVPEERRFAEPRCCETTTRFPAAAGSPALSGKRSSGPSTATPRAFASRSLTSATSGRRRARAI